mmetsp:Transcript_22573/g.52569  ORF Transcript_22573/g.52569 Transcript_22573/m.52569 type:complete len:367 (+) Transcript_22573:115-1215(+)
MAASTAALENDPMIEASFRRLISAMESERDRIRGTWQQVEQEKLTTTAELDRLRRETEEWCFAEKQKIEAEWRRLDALAENMRSFWPDTSQLLHINCSGTKYTIPRSTLCCLEDSHLARMFSDDFIQEIPRDSDGRFFLDFNGQCFAIIIEYLQNRRLKPDCPIPVVPGSQQDNMDMLAQALKLKPFLRENRINPSHATSLQVKGNVVAATHPGWQVISSEHPLPVAHPSYFEVNVLANPDVKGGLAVGVCGKIPTGSEVHSIRLQNAILYNSSNGLLGDCYDDINVDRAVQLVEGSSFGVRYDPSTFMLSFFQNRSPIGTVKVKEEKVPHMTSLYAVLALYVPEQTVEVDFHAKPPFPYLGIKES